MGEGRMTRALCAFAAACALGCMLWCTSARATSLADGVQAYENMELDDAAEKLAKARRSSSSKDKPSIELWLGIVELERGNEATARRWLKSALRANPRLTVEQELSPKIVATIEAVRTQVTSSSAPPAPPAPVAAPPPVVDDEPAPVAVVAPTAPVAAPVVPYVAPNPIAAAPAAPIVAPAVQPIATPSAAIASRAPGADADAPGADGPSPLIFVTAATGAVSAGALVGGAVLGTIARVGSDAANREPIASVATERYQEASTAAVAANGLFIAGGVAAVASAVCGVLVFVDGEAP